MQHRVGIRTHWSQIASGINHDTAPEPFSHIESISHSRSDAGRAAEMCQWSCACMAIDEIDGRCRGDVPPQPRGRVGGAVVFDEGRREPSPRNVGAESHRAGDGGSATGAISVPFPRRSGPGTLAAAFAALKSSTACPPQPRRGASGRWNPSGTLR
jgi:hypothetical protein